MDGWALEIDELEIGGRFVLRCARGRGKGAAAYIDDFVLWFLRTLGLWMLAERERLGSARVDTVYAATTKRAIKNHVEVTELCIQEGERSEQDPALQGMNLEMVPLPVARQAYSRNYSGASRQATSSGLWC